MFRLSFTISIIVVLSYFGFAQSPHGSKLDIECIECHTVEGWKDLKNPLSFKHESTGFLLTGTHVKTDCKSCHTSLVFSEQRKECSSCHADVHQGTLQNDCERCHTTDTWLIEDVSKIHNSISFPLLGQHKAADCNSCHTTINNRSFTPLDRTCFACHKTEYYATSNPNHVLNAYPTDCSACHSVSAASWQGATFAHNGFPLVGAHVGVECKSCHGADTYSEVESDCFSCHGDEYSATNNPSHKSLNLDKNCLSCHELKKGWDGASFSVHSQYYPLVGSHVNQSCNSCHQSGKYDKMAHDCVDCHLEDYNKTVNPNHAVAQYPKTCQSCHNENTWQGATFEHSKFPLTQAHATVNCNQCHTSGTYGTIPSNCSSCHDDNYAKTTNPNHGSLQISKECQTCHTTKPGWKPAQFPIHYQFYQLVGTHKNIANNCTSCHTTGNYTKMAHECYDCHSDNYAATTNPNHAVANYPKTCLSCHTQDSWKTATFDHSKFPLTNAHGLVSCNECHTTGTYGTIPSNCSSCHDDNYAKTTNPNHGGLQISKECQTCHTTKPGWKPAQFPIHDQFYQLVGTHKNIANNCTSCHTTGNYTKMAHECYDCHSDNYTATTNPPHQAAGFPKTCLSCHTQDGWKPATYDHSKFPLTGVHNVATCSSCHSSGVYTGLSHECVSCHKKDYDKTVNPSHTSLNISQDCQVCHTLTPDWKPAKFPIHDQFFQLVGIHKTLADDCTKCHTSGTYTKMAHECFDCHSSDFTKSVNPNHTTLKFPHECLVCHTQTSWKPTTFNHDASYFPIYSGNHKGEWATCGTCHVNPSNYKVFECINCHEHNKSKMDSKHKSVSGYSYNSIACYNCHPRGNFLIKSLKRLPQIMKTY